MKKINDDILIIQEANSSEVLELYRVVGEREEKCVRDTKMFIPGHNSLEGRQFACRL